MIELKSINLSKILQFDLINKYKKVVPVGFEPTRNSADDLKSPPLTARAQYFVDLLQSIWNKYKNIRVIDLFELEYRYIN